MSFDIKELVDNPDIYNYLLPFLLVFTLTFALLQKIKLFGSDENQNRKYSGVMAIVLALLVIRNGYIIELLHRFLPNISFFIIVILLTLVVIGMFLPAEYKGLTGGLLGFMVLVSLGLTFWALGADQLGFEVPYWLQDWYYSTTIIEKVLLVVVILGFWVILKKTDSGKRDPFTKITEFVGRGLGSK